MSIAPRSLDAASSNASSNEKIIAALESTFPTSGAVYKFRLYVADDSPNSATARTNLAFFCEHYLCDRHEIEIVDVFREPLRAQDDRVSFTPMLIKMEPLPVCRIVGTLSNTPDLVTALTLTSLYIDPDDLALLEDRNASVADWVGRLVCAGEELEKLTRGEIDAVSDREGRSVLLPHSQLHLLQSEAVRQTAILNAIPAHVALLDKQGIIVSSNQAWKRFADANFAVKGAHEIGTSYFEFCNLAIGADAADTSHVSAGIRSVLDGGQPQFSFECRHPSPSGECWFILFVTPITESWLTGAVVMHVDITARKLAERAQRQLGIAVDAMGDALYLVDRTTMRLIYVNDAACRRHNQTHAELLAGFPWQMLDTTRNSLEQAYDELITSGIAAKPLEIFRQLEDGSLVWAELRRHAQRDEKGWTIVTIVRDITDRKEAEQRIRRLNRVYAMLSSINTLIVHSFERDSLLRSACQIALDAGGFGLAWIGIVDRNAMRIVPIAYAGPEPDFHAVAKDWLSLRSEASEKDSISVRAVRSKAPVVSDEITETSNIFLAKLGPAQGMRSIVALPLMVANEALGVLTLYATEVGVLDEEELAVLTKMVGDIALSIDQIDKQRRLDYLTTYDELTGLANRTLFVEQVDQFVHTSFRKGGALVIFLLDVERFKNINYTLGRKAGDTLLVLLAEWIARKVGNVNSLARIGGDRFALSMHRVRADVDVEQLVETILAGLSDYPFKVHDVLLRVSVRVGVAQFPNDGGDAEVLLKNAELALKAARSSGDRYRIYVPSMSVVVARTLTLENKLRQALLNDEFVLFYQPKINIATGKLTGAEALIRWHDQHSGLVAPSEFIPILEETGLIHDVGRWALQKAISDYLRWRAAGHSGVPISVNVSPRQLRDSNFVKEIELALSVDPHAAAGLELEITESVIMADVRQSIASLDAIRALNVTIAIDDFGTGFSSLSYLSKLPIDTLKIDRSFIVDMTETQKGLALVSTMISLAHSLQLNVVAEGVETQEQRRLLYLLNCNEMQGFLISKPLPVAEFESQFLAPLTALFV